MLLKIGILKSFAIFIEKQLRWSFFLIKLQAFSPATLLERDSKVFLSKLQNFYEQLF